MSNKREYAVQITWQPGIEIVPAKDKSHAWHMLSTIFRGNDAVVVERLVSQWSPVREVES